VTVEAPNAHAPTAALEQERGSSIGEVTVAIVRSMIETARSKKYFSGIIGIRARPTWSGPEAFSYSDQSVKVVACVSALMVREAIRNHVTAARPEADSGPPHDWLVIVTDRDESDLGAGILAHLVFERLRTPDPWDAVRQVFHASALDRNLANAEHVKSPRQLANGLLDARPLEGWPPAPGGVLTRDHALRSVAARYLLAGPSDRIDGLADVPGDIDATTVWLWSTNPDATHRIADLRRIAGETLTAETLRWLADRTGLPSGKLLPLLERGLVADAVPLGLLLGLLADILLPDTPGRIDGKYGVLEGDARQALVRIEVPLGGDFPPRTIARIWAADAKAVTVASLRNQALRDQALSVLERADHLLGQIKGRSLAATSDLLPSGLTARLEHLARVLRTAVSARSMDALASDPSLPLVDRSCLDRAERAWARVEEHALAGAERPDGDRRVKAFHGAVRLARWLAEPAPSIAGFSPFVARYRDEDSWAEAAFIAAARGVDDADLGDALQRILTAARARRETFDRAFATALARHTAEDAPLTDPGLVHIEDLLARHVLPLVKAHPVLLVVLDGMSLAAAIDLAPDVATRYRWREVVPVEGRRIAAVAALPTETATSRASLFCGELRTGGQHVERDGLRALARKVHVDGAVLYHRGLLEENRLGMAVSDDVAAAIADVDGRRLVACVLNTIDDALGRDDPGGRTWTIGAIRHLEPLLRQAWQAGRCVVLTADHGHVIDRGDGTARTHRHVLGARVRGADGTGPAADEVLLAGRRVLAGDGQVVLAVNERLRYGDRRAGYHGGATPAEVVVPLVTLVPAGLENVSGMKLAPAQEPRWWRDPDELPLPARRASPEPPETLPSRLPAAQPASAVPMLPLFDSEPAATDQVASEAGGGTSISEGAQLADQVLDSAVFREQRKLTRGRGAPEQDNLRALLTALLDAPGNRLTQQQTAVALGEHPLSVRRAVMSAIRLLNVEGYPVLSVDADGTTTVLNVGLLREQFDL